MLRSLNLMLIFVVILMAGCGKKTENGKSAEPEKVAVETMAARIGSITISKSYTGTLEGIEQADLYAKLAETVEKILVHLGDHVKEGQLLITLDKGGPSSQYHQAEAVFLNAKKLQEKYQNLYQEGAVSENDLDRANTEFKVAEANFRAARELVEIVSPIAGEITALNVNAGDQAHVGRQLVTVSQTERIRLKVGVDPEDVNHIHVGDTISISPQDDNDSGLSGLVNRVASSADPVTRAFSVEITADNQNGLLRPGNFTSITLKLYTLDDILLVPRDAILLQKGISKLCKLAGDTAKVVEVKLGQTDGVSTQILSGLTAGEQVIITGQAFVSDGTLVKAVNRKAAQ